MKVAARRILIAVAGAVVVGFAGSGFATGFALPTLDAQAVDAPNPPMLTNASWETMLRSAAH